jgi:hypothetical protein
VQRSLQEHIARLEEKIAALKMQMLADGELAYHRERDLDLANAEQALILFRKAYELEQKISK